MLQERADESSEQDELHNLPPQNHSVPPSPATRIRLLHSLLTAPAVQKGLGITPGEGKWSRVKSIAALHDEEANKAWLKQWSLGGDWQVGLLKGLDSEQAGLGSHVSPKKEGCFTLIELIR
jgi:anoctamin-10